MIKELVRRIEEMQRFIDARANELDSKGLMQDREYCMYVGQWMGLKNAYSLITGEKYDHRGC